MAACLLLGAQLQVGKLLDLAQKDGLRLRRRADAAGCTASMAPHPASQSSSEPSNAAWEVACLLLGAQLQVGELLDLAREDGLRRRRRVDARGLDGDDVGAPVLEEELGIEAHNAGLVRLRYVGKDAVHLRSGCGAVRDGQAPASWRQGWVLPRRFSVWGLGFRAAGAGILEQEPGVEAHEASLVRVAASAKTQSSHAFGGTEDAHSAQGLCGNHAGVPSSQEELDGEVPHAGRVWLRHVSKDTVHLHSGHGEMRDSQALDIARAPQGARHSG